MQMFLRNAPPFLKWRAVSDGKALQKVTLVEVGSLAQPLSARYALPNPTVPNPAGPIYIVVMAGAFVQQRLEGGHIQATSASAPSLAFQCS